MIEKWKRALDQNVRVGAIFMNLSKSFAKGLLLLAKLKAYGFQQTALKKLENYLADCFQRTKLSNSYSSWSETIAGLPKDPF